MEIYSILMGIEICDGKYDPNLIACQGRNAHCAWVQIRMSPMVGGVFDIFADGEKIDL